jgi:hypothetical protein
MATEQEQLEFLYEEIRRLDSELENQIALNQKMVDSINELYEALSYLDEFSRDSFWDLHSMIKKHVNGFHSMLLVAPDKEKKDESNIS